MENFGIGTGAKIFFEKTLDKSHHICYNIYSEREVITMEQIYNLVEEWSRKGLIGEEEWLDFCETIVIELLEQNSDLLKRLKNM
jgi:hypothetical protein